MLLYNTGIIMSISTGEVKIRQVKYVKTWKIFILLPELVHFIWSNLE